MDEYKHCVASFLFSVTDDRFLVDRKKFSKQCQKFYYFQKPVDVRITGIQDNCLHERKSLLSANSKP